MLRPGQRRDQELDAGGERERLVGLWSAERDELVGSCRARQDVPVRDRAHRDELVPFGGPQAHKAFALAVGVELVVAALAGPEHGALVIAARPEHDPVPGFRALADGLRLPGDGG